MEHSTCTIKYNRKSGQENVHITSNVNKPTYFALCL